MISLRSLRAWPVLLAAYLALVLTVQAQSLNASSSTQSSSPSGDDQLQLSAPQQYPGPSNRAPRVNLVNLTEAAVTKLSAAAGTNEIIHQNIAFVAPNSSYSANIFSSNTIAILPCDAGPGFLSPLNALEDAIQRAVPAVVLYSASNTTCNLQTGGPVSNNYVIYSTNDSSAWQTIQRANLQASSFGNYGSQWGIARKTVLDNLTMSTGNANTGFGSNPGNPSPSTAVAMIILYSITGVITALFLVIIVTGAIRAHRHPERYGPRNVLGRPRQSRAKGLARAMLETLPIVKFGEREEDKQRQRDVEMANAKTADVEDGDAASTVEAPAAKPKEGDSTAEGEAAKPADADEVTTAAAKPAAPAQEDQDTQSCSICTEDFEKGEDVRMLPCNHCFHPACIDPWLLNVSGTCPLCRIDLRPADQQHSEALDTRASAEGPLPPPLNPDAAAASGLTVPNNRASRRLSGFVHDILNPHRMQGASQEERVAALRQLRERGQQNPGEEAETRRRRRLTARLGETFGVRTRARDSSPPTETRSGSVTSPSSMVTAPETTSGAPRSVAEESIPEETAAASSSTANNTTNRPQT